MSNSENNWHPLTKRDLSPEILHEIKQNSPNTPVLRTWILRKFLEQNPGSQIVGIDHKPENTLVRWLWYQYESCEVPVFVRKWPRIHNLVFLNYSNKASLIAQRHCSICNSREPLGPNFLSFFAPVRVRGISHQSASSATLRALTRAMKDRLKGRALSVNSNSHFCLALTFVLNKSRRDRDLDNMAKAMQDAVARALNFNDSRIVHLDIVKLVFPSAEEFVYFRLATSSLSTHDDVLGMYFNHIFGGQPRLDIS